MGCNTQIEFTQGDTATLQMTANNGAGSPFNIVGATFTTYVKGVNGSVVEFDNSQHTIVNAALGRYNLALSSLDTASCGLGDEKDILTLIVQGGSTIYFRGIGILKVNPPIPEM